MSVARKLGVLAQLIWILAACSAPADSLDGRVVRIKDGDTLVLLLEEKKQTITVRLAGIDTPEKGQPWGRKAKQALSARIAGKTVALQPRGKDRYGRTIGDIFDGDEWINRWLVCAGHAWVYRKYSKNPKLLACERQARADQRGLWSLPAAERIPPWEWRKHRR